MPWGVCGFLPAVRSITMAFGYYSVPNLSVTQRGTRRYRKEIIAGVGDGLEEVTVLPRCTMLSTPKKRTR